MEIETKFINSNNNNNDDDDDNAPAKIEHVSSRLEAAPLTDKASLSERGHCIFISRNGSLKCSVPTVRDARCYSEPKRLLDTSKFPLRLGCALI